MIKNIIDGPTNSIIDKIDNSDDETMILLNGNNVSRFDDDDDKNAVD